MRESGSLCISWLCSPLLALLQIVVRGPPGVISKMLLYSSASQHVSLAFASFVELWKVSKCELIINVIVMIFLIVV